MKKLFCLALAVCLLFTGCGKKNESDIDTSHNQDIAAENINDIEFTYRNTEIAHGNNISFSCTFTNHTDKVLNAEMVLKGYDDNNQLTRENTYFVMNLGKELQSGTLFSFPIGTQRIEHEVKSYYFTDGIQKTPKITDENLYDFVKISVKDEGNVAFGQFHPTVYINNLTSQYFNGNVKITVLSDGKIIDEEISVMDNVNPYSNTLKVMGFDVVDDYKVEYEILDYNFTDKPITD